MFRYEVEDNPNKKPPLRFYRVIDDDRGLRLELRRSDQNTYEYWLWWRDRCLLVLVDRLPSAPGTTDINLAITTRLYDRVAKGYLDDQTQAVVVPLMREALEAIWRGSRRVPISKFTVVDPPAN